MPAIKKPHHPQYDKCHIYPSCNKINGKPNKLQNEDKSPFKSKKIKIFHKSKESMMNHFAKSQKMTVKNNNVKHDGYLYNQIFQNLECINH